MRKSRSIKALLCVSAAAGLASLFGANANAANTYTWLPTNQQTFTGATQGPHWNLSTNWSGTSSTYPQAAGDKAIISVPQTSNQYVIIPDATSPSVGYTLGTLIMGDTGTNNAGATDGGLSYAQTLYNTSATLTFDSGVAGVPAVLTEQTASYGTGAVRDAIYMNIALNSDLIINLNAGTSANGLLIRSAGDTITATGHFVTVNSTGSQTILKTDTNEVGGTWVINAKLGISGIASDAHFNADEIIINPTGKMQCYEAEVIGFNTLVVNNGTINFGAQTVFGEAMGALAGTSSSWGGAGAMLLFGGSVATSTPNYSGSLYNTWTELDGGTQEFSGTTINTSGPTVVNGGLLLLNKTGAGAYAISGAGDTISAYATQGPMLNINGGAVQLLQANQIDPAVPITIDGGALKLTGNSQVSTLPLTLVSNPNDSSIINVIDFGTTNPSVTNTILSFADSSSVTWNGSNQVQNWIGLLAGGGQDQFKVGSAATLSGGQLSALKFVNAEGTLGTSVGATQLASGEIVPSGLPAMWGGPAGGSWNAGGSWTNGSAPNATHAYANFVGSPFAVGLTGSAVTVTLDGSKTVGAVNFNSTNGVTVNAGSGGSLTINDSGDPAGVNPAIYVQRGTHAINVPVVMNNGLTVYMSNASSLTLGSTLTGPGNIAVTGAGTTTLGTTTVLPATANVAVSSGATLALPFAVGSQSVAGVSIDATSTLAVGKQMMSVPDATGLGSALYNTTVAEIKAGYVNHLGHGIVLTAGSPANAAVGIIDVSGTLKFGYTILGDATMDGSVGFSDLVKVAQNYNKTNTTWQSGDVSYDGTTNFSDLVKVAQNYTQHVTGEQVAQLDAIDPAFAANWSAAQAVAAAVPEPASLGLLAVGAVGLLSRRRRHA